MSETDWGWDATLTLLTRARGGDAQALEELCARYIPVMQRWAHGHLPTWARSLAETHELVQEALVETFKRIERFEHHGEGALRAYLRQAVMNRIRDELRRANRRPPPVELDDTMRQAGISPLDGAIGAWTVERYDAALQRLSDDERELIIARIEMGLTYSELANAVGKPTAGAARMAVGQALGRLSREMGGSG